MKYFRNALCLLLTLLALLSVLPAQAEFDAISALQYRSTYSYAITQSRNVGTCRTLRGDIALTVVMVSTDGQDFTIRDLSDVQQSVNEAISALEDEAAAYGIALNITPTYYRTSGTSQVDDKGWLGTTLASVPELAGVADWSGRPILFCLNTEGRCYASTGSALPEHVIFYIDNEPSTVRHELLHLYGAEDFYFHDGVKAAAQKHLPDSIMLSSGNPNAHVDSLTAYLVGWTDQPDAVATAFLDEIATLSTAEVDAAHEKDQQSGTGMFQLRDSTYYGTLEMGTRNGLGLNQWSSGATYVGGWSWDMLHGQGTYVWASGSSYTGDYVNDERTGKGTYTWADGDSYTGDFVDGDHTGKGTYTWADGDSYTGDFVNNACTGKGTYSWASGNSYTGDFADDKRNGKGTYTWVSGSSYTGDFADNQLHGKGTYTWADGESYTGDFVDNERTGKGTYTWPSGSSYTGDFVDGKRTGKGTYTWTDGASYTGEFVSGVISGRGMLTYANGDVYIGEFLDGSLHGKGVMYYADGTVRSGQWSQGAYVGP